MTNIHTHTDTNFPDEQKWLRFIFKTTQKFIFPTVIQPDSNPFHKSIETKHYFLYIYMFPSSQILFCSITYPRVMSYWTIFLRCVCVYSVHNCCLSHSTFLVHFMSNLEKCFTVATLGQLCPILLETVFVRSIHEK